jgi:hypothetical protein
MKCSDCNRELEVGDRYIEDSASAFLGRDADPEIDGLIADILGGTGGKVVYCEDCTQEGGHWKLNTVYGDEEAA